MALSATHPALAPRRHGRTDLTVTALGLGGAGYGRNTVTDAEAVASVESALGYGITMLDTSPLYGESERRLGLALEGVPRGQYVLSTKTGTHPQRRGDYSWDATLWSVENSLRLLKVDYFDMVLVHDPDDMTPVLAPRGALEALEALKRQGVLRHIGLGQRHHSFHRLAIETGRFDVILTYNDYHPVRTTALDELLPLAARHDVGVLNGSPLAHGLLIGEDPERLNQRLHMRAPERDLAAAVRFYRWCQEHNVSMPGVALQFCLRQPLIHCTLTGAKTPAELEENLLGIATQLPDSLWDELAALGLTDGQE
jgi:aryl-alcohol dehydrogenase-like predicted oxidoreductase